MAAPEKEAPKDGAAAQASVAAAPAAAAGGIKSFLPLIITLVAMPALAYVTTSFLLIPKLKSALGAPAVAAKESEHASEEHGSKEGEHGAAKEEHGAKSEGHGAKSADGKISYPFGKVLVNVSGSLGSRYLLAQFTLVGSKSSFKDKIESKKDQLIDLASSTLGTKTLVDLEKPGARNLIRAELISVFNNALGSGTVQEIYFTEFAIQ